MDLKALSRHPDLAQVWMEKQQKANERLLREVHRLRHLVYGEKRERFVPANNQPELPFEDNLNIEIPDFVHEAPDDEQTEEAPGKKRRPHGITKIKPEVPRHRHEEVVPAKDRICKHCHGEMQKFGEDLKHVVEYVPAHLEVHEFARAKYSCPKCKNAVVTAPIPRSPIEKGLPGPGLLAQVCVSKYADHLPLNRMEGILDRYGIEVSKQTMCDWVSAVARMLAPILEALESLVMASAVVRADETTLLVQIPKVKSGHKKGYLWVRQNLRGEVLFRYHPSRGSAAAAEYLSEFDGWLQVDGYAGYDFLFRKPGGPVEVGCWAHARRKFYDTKDDHPLETDYVLKRIQELYEVERSIRERKLKRRAIEKERAEKSAPILKNLHDWMLQHKGK
ncbi:IS66 family transposase, partial [Candidatus Azambacteria bacterium]|nr:IS66 family transposase [Candidatus Azambacteria bacterium]